MKKQTPTQKPKEAADDLAHLEILLRKILELAQKGTLPLKAADALKIIELKQKLTQNKTSKEELFRPFLEMLKRAGRPKGKTKEKSGLEK
ncbi:MAG: hypothetical protein L0Z48_07110 [candidate division Zixibacteria bacterium]|nr:hypothetical protein [candidate division Zixibacteria bacterium]